MTLILKTKEYIGKTVGRLELFLTKIKVNLSLKEFVKNQDADTVSFDIYYKPDGIKIVHIKKHEGKEFVLDARFLFTDDRSDINERISMYPIILAEAMKILEFKNQTLAEVKDRCLVDTEDRNVIEFVWANVIIMRSRFLVKRFNSRFFVAVSSDGLDFERYYDVYDHLDTPPLFFCKQKYKESFIRNLKSLVEEELN